MSDFVNNDYQLQLRDIIGQLWGYKRLFYFPVNELPKRNESKYEGLTALDYKFIQKSSLLGTPIIMPLKMQITPKGQPVDFWEFPNEPIVEIKGTKKIITTDIDGQEGSFKEIYSLGDYSISIKGVAVTESGDSEDYPEDTVRRLRQIYEMRHHLEVVHPLFTLFNIKHIAITDFNLPSIEGAPGMQPYEFMALSDKEFELELKPANRSLASF